MAIDPSVFRAYDIRGVVPDQMTADDAEQVGRAFAQLMCEQVRATKLVVGRDVRLTGPEFHVRVVAGITRMGLDVLDIGVVSTDAFYYACGSRNLPGIMVTASHNPPEYNGFKMVRALPDLLLASEFKPYVLDRTYSSADRAGSVETVDIIGEFLDHLLKIIPARSIKPLKVVIDTSNGAQGPIIEQLAKRLPIKIVPLCFEPDGNFPSHGNDVIQPENQTMLREAVVREAADLGLLFDPDGDRCMLVDDRGRTVTGDFVTALLSVYMLERFPGGTVIYDVRASDVVPDLITAAGGKPCVWKVGHVYIKAKMLETGAVFGGEVSGHYYFKDFWSADCGLLSALTMLAYTSELSGTLSQKVEQLEQQYHISGEINSKVTDVVATMKRVKEVYKDAEIDESMGLSIRYPSWHCVVRPSDNEPLLRLTLEARTAEEMIRRRDEVLALIRQNSA